MIHVIIRSPGGRSTGEVIHGWCLDKSPVQLNPVITWCTSFAMITSRNFDNPIVVKIMSWILSPAKMFIAVLSCGVMGMATAVFLHASSSDRAEAVGSITHLDPALQRAFSNGGSFTSKRKPGSNDWLAAYKEPGQTFEQWRESAPNQPGNGRTKLYIMPIGEFTAGVAPDREHLRAYTAAYFHPMHVDLLPSVVNQDVPAQERVRGGRKQWKSTDILAWLPKMLPKDAYAMIAVTMTDLYPDEAWNFVFGQATIKERVGVFSFARYQPSWQGDAVGEGVETIVLKRAAKVLTHEMGHMFGMHHCIYYECNMNGSNHLEEADATPMHSCPVCLRKMHHAVQFDPVERYQRLQSFYQSHGWKQEQAWVGNRIAFIRGAGFRE